MGNLVVSARGRAGRAMGLHREAYDRKAREQVLDGLPAAPCHTLRLCEEGAHRYDMSPLTGLLMAYKSHWTEIRLPTETWISS